MQVSMHIKYAHIHNINLKRLAGMDVYGSRELTFLDNGLMRTRSL